jgi:hypothetical protein
MARNISPPPGARSNARAQHVDLQRRQWLGSNFQPTQGSREWYKMKDPDMSEFDGKRVLVTGATIPTI